MRRLLLLSCLCVVAPAGQGCAVLQRWADLGGTQAPRETRFTPTAALAAPDPAAVVDRLYARAAQAISVRDYALALDLLQVAAARAPDDVRVLNAQGVVYDKLGRFDLSVRYYAHALRVDPHSAIVAHNQAYSAFLQGQEAVSNQARLAPSVVSTPDPIAPPPPAPVVIEAAAPARIAVRPVEIVDATGFAQGAKPIHLALARLGWSVALTASAPQTSPRSVLIYGHGYHDLARALARSLPFAPAIAAGEGGGTHLKLILGADAVRPEAQARTKA
ncbi:LytR C-terminal domain-containing protein [Caulobacter sp. LARHSG274]